MGGWGHNQNFLLGPPTKARPREDHILSNPKASITLIQKKKKKDKESSRGGGIWNQAQESCRKVDVPHLRSLVFVVYYKICVCSGVGMYCEDLWT